MANFNFRQGLVRYQTDITNNPTFLILNGQYVDLVVSPDPTVFVLAHLTEDYVVAENTSVSQAWGPFTGLGTEYLYWDIDLLTGDLSRDSTDLQPITASIAPVAPAVGQMWFDLTRNGMYEWSGTRWIIKVRVMAATLVNSSILTPEVIGTQVGLNTPTFAGAILFDDDQVPVQKWSRTRDGLFLTSETPLASQFTRTANFRVEAAIIQAKAGENIPIHHAVAYTGPNIIGLARNTLPGFPAIGISSEDMTTDEVRSFITKGYVQNFLDWNWTEPAGTSIFVGLTGELTTSPPQVWSIQRIAQIVDPITIYVNTQDIVLY